MDLHGASVPVIDLCRASGLPSGEDHFDTRIIVADYVTPEGAHHHWACAPNALGVQDVRDDQLTDSGVQAAPFLGQVASDSKACCNWSSWNSCCRPDCARCCSRRRTAHHDAGPIHAARRDRLNLSKSWSNARSRTAWSRPPPPTMTPTCSRSRPKS
jgi:hypothetical protein